VVLDDGRELDCRLPARLASRQRSDLAPGDRVEVRRGPEPGRGTLLRVLPRRSALSRPGPSRSGRHREHLIAANVDDVVVVVAAAEPAWRPGLVDRMALAAEQGGARPVVCLNKLDRVAAHERAALERGLEPYRRLGLPVVETCAARAGDPGVAGLASLLRGRTAVLAGPSGTGKSSLLNLLVPDAAASVSAVARSTGKGRHTTTSARLYPLPGGGCVIDTPGVREFGLWCVEASAVLSHFRDVAEHAAGCRFRSCRHVAEPGCAVRAAVESGALSPARLESLRRLLAEAGAR